MKSKIQPAAIEGIVDSLKELGFKPNKTMLLRRSHDGRVVQVINVQKGRNRLTGKFTLELGSFLPSVYGIEMGERAPNEPGITHCHIRERWGRFAGVGDLWWKSDDLGEIDTLVAALRRDVPLFFQRFGEVHAILEAWRANRLPMVSSYLPAVLLHEEQRDEEARQYIQRWRETVSRNNGDPSFLGNLERALALGVHR